MIAGITNAILGSGDAMALWLIELEGYARAQLSRNRRAHTIIRVSAHQHRFMPVSSAAERAVTPAQKYLISSF